MRINCYGEETEDLANDKNLPRQPLETKESGGSTYLRFGEGERVPIHRLTVGGARSGSGTSDGVSGDRVTI